MTVSLSTPLLWTADFGVAKILGDGISIPEGVGGEESFPS